jgi:hypothetical protein
VRIDVTNPDPIIRSRSAQYKFVFEEFYDKNVTSRNVTLVLRDCQIPMWKWRARRDEGQVDKPDSTCFPRFIPQSLLEGAPCAIASRRYGDSKQLTGSEDFLWGFHPLAFNRQAIQDAMLWIMESRWQLPVQ